MSENVAEEAETQAVLDLLARDQIGDTVQLPKEEGKKIQSLKFSEKPEAGTLFALRGQAYIVTKAPKTYNKDHEWNDSSVWVKKVAPSKEQKPLNLNQLSLHEHTRKFLGMP